MFNIFKKKRSIFLILRNVMIILILSSAGSVNANEFSIIWNNQSYDINIPDDSSSKTVTFDCTYKSFLHTCHWGFGDDQYIEDLYRDDFENNNFTFSSSGKTRSVTKTYAKNGTYTVRVKVCVPNTTTCSPVSGWDITIDDGTASWKYKGCCFTDAVTASDGTLYATSSGKKIYRSTDRGASWYKIGDCCFVDVAVAPDGTVYGVSDGKKIYKYSGSGTSWSKITGNFCFLQMTIDSKGNFYGVSSSNNMYRSLNKGSSWSYIGCCFIDVATAASTDNWRDVVYGVSTGNYIYRYADLSGSTSWSKIAANCCFRALTIASDNTFYGVSYGKEIYRTTNKGASWDKISNCCFLKSTATTDGTVYGVSGGDNLYVYE